MTLTCKVPALCCCPPSSLPPPSHTLLRVVIAGIPASLLQYEDAKRHYDNEVMQHGDALKRYAALDTAHSALQQRLSSTVAQLDEARLAKVRRQ